MGVVCIMPSICTPKPYSIYPCSPWVFVVERRWLKRLLLHSVMTPSLNPHTALDPWFPALDDTNAIAVVSFLFSALNVSTSDNSLHICISLAHLIQQTHAPTSRNPPTKFTELAHLIVPPNSPNPANEFTCFTHVAHGTYLPNSPNPHISFTELTRLTHLTDLQFF